MKTRVARLAVNVAERGLRRVVDALHDDDVDLEHPESGIGIILTTQASDQIISTTTFSDYEEVSDHLNARYEEPSEGQGILSRDEEMSDPSDAEYAASSEITDSDDTLSEDEDLSDTIYSEMEDTSDNADPEIEDMADDAGNSGNKNVYGDGENDDGPYREYGRWKRRIKVVTQG